MRAASETGAGMRVVVIGAGSAGFTAARELARRGLEPVALEQSSSVGGLSRTETYKGYHFDMGGHRFFNYPLKPLNALAGLGRWRAMMVVLSYLRWQVFPYRQDRP